MSGRRLLAGDGPGAAVERDAPFIFDGVSPNLDEERERRNKGKRGQRGGTGKNCRGGREEPKYTHGLLCPVKRLRDG